MSISERLDLYRQAAERLDALAKMDTPADGHLDGLLGDEEEEDDLQAKVRKWGQVPILKAAPERRFVLAPIYIPGRVDAHGEWASADDLQQALWKMVQGGDRSVNLQHIGGTHIGEWVEIMCWPYPHTATLTNPADGTVRKVDLPANTPWLGVLWTPPAFEAVKKGLLRSFSMEGKSRRVVADIPLSP